MKNVSHTIPNVTLAIIKPDAIERNMEILMDIFGAGIEVTARRPMTLTLAEARAFYAEHAGQPYFDALTEFMASGPVEALVLSTNREVPVWQQWRAKLGATSSAEAIPGTLRAKYGNKTIIRENALHGSDSYERAVWEIEFFFPTYFQIAIAA